MTVKSKERKDEFGEVFTPPEVIREMLSELPDGILNDSLKTFLDPTCGNGNILVTILEERLKLGLDPVQSASTLYGIDIQADNVQETIQRLSWLVPEATKIISKHIRRLDTTIWLDRIDDFDWESDKEWIESIHHSTTSDFF